MLAVEHDIEARLKSMSAAGTAAEEKDNKMYEAMCSVAGRSVYSTARVVFDVFSLVFDKLERFFGRSQVSLLGDDSGILRAVVLVRSFTCLICLWWDLSENEKRRDVMQKCVNTLRDPKGLGKGPPHACVDLAVSMACGGPALWDDAPSSKRLRCS